MIKKSIWWVLFWGLYAVGFIPGAVAQTGAGAIQGTVKDPSGAVIPGAKISITQADTKVTSQTETNKDGFYIVPSLFTAEYSVKVEAPGMRPWEGHVALRVGQTATVDAQLDVGAATAQVTVAGDVTPLITTDSPTTNTTLERARIEQLPINGRSLLTLTSDTTPGVEGQRSNGLRESAFEFVQDGTPLANRDQGGLDFQPPDPDSVEEMRIENSNSSAKFNRPATAVLTTRSGTNQIHGTAFETNRDNSYGIARNRQDSYTSSAPKFIRNEFGASVGGPIYFPYLGPGPKLYRGRDSSFFFVAWERLELRNNFSRTLYVPTMAMRQGDFSALTNGSGQGIVLYDNQTTAPASPWTRQPFPDNQIPMSRLSPLAKALYAITPPPTNNANPMLSTGFNWIGPTPNNQTTTSFTTRLDHHFSEKNTAYLRYTWGHNEFYKLGSTALGPPTLHNEANVTFQPIKTQGAAIGWTHIFSPRFFNEFVAAMNYEGDTVQTGPDPSHNYAADLGLENNYGLLGWPYITGTTQTGTGNTSMLMGYGQGDNTRRNGQYINVFDDNVSMVLGRHLLQFGGRYRHERIHILPDQPYPSRAIFSQLGTAIYDPKSGTQYSALNNTGAAVADFFIGDSQEYQNTLAPAYLRLRDQEIAAYIQDDIHVQSNLVFNVGLRWEAHPALHEKYNQFTAFDFANHAIVTGKPLDQLYQLGFTSPQIVSGMESIGVKFETTEQAGLPSSVINNQLFTFGPRLGLAYRPFQRSQGTVIRGGYGTYIYPPPTRNFYASLNGQVPYTNAFQQDYTNPVQTDGLQNYILRSQQTVVAGQNSSDAINFNAASAFTPGTFTIGVLDHDYPVTYVQEWNATLEQQFKGQSALRISYVGNHGNNLEQYWYNNTKPSNYVWFETTGQPLPTGRYSNTATRPYDKTTYGELEVQRKTGYSNLNSIQINFQRLYNKGFAYQVFYVYSAALKNGGNGFRDSVVYPFSTFLPGTMSSYPDYLNRFQNYYRDTAIPKHRVRYNWLVDLPFGNGRRYFSGVNRFVNEFIGGWEIGGIGSMGASYFQPAQTDWGPFTPIHTYGRKYKIDDCRSGVCNKGYLYYNGYIPQYQINTAKGVTGIPSNYTPAHSPVIPLPPSGPPAGGCSKNPDPNCPYYGSQTVFVRLANGTTVATPYAPGPQGAPGGSSQGVHPYSRSFLLGPLNWSTDASIFKVFPISEKIGLRLQGDFFNVFNQQGTNYPDSSTGLINTTSSYNTARQIQLTARLTW